MNRKLSYALFGLIFVLITGSISSAKENAGAAGYVSGGRNIVADQYVVNEGNPPVPDKAKWLGDFSGKWYNIGKKVAQSCGDSFRIVADVRWGKLVELYGEYDTREAMKVYEAQIQAFSPEIISFMHGQADGGSEWLSQSNYADICTPYDLVLAAEIYDDWWRRHPENPETYPWKVAKTNVPKLDPLAAVGCSSFALTGAASESGKTLVGHVRHTSYYDAYQAAYAAQPTDGNKFWVLGSFPVAAGNAVVNNKGVYVAETAGGRPNPLYPEYIVREFGVPWHCVLLYCAAYADTAQEAIQIIIAGTEHYRKITGRNTLNRCGGINFLVADKDTLAVVECTANRYAIRYPGDFTPGWNDQDFIVLTNHQLCEYSYDQDNTLTDVPMTLFGSELTNNVLNETGQRFWALMWDIKHNYGSIDKYKAEHFMKGHHGYDKDSGQIMEVAQNNNGDWIPFYKKWGSGGVTCPHSGSPSAIWGTGLAGSGTDGKLVVPDGKSTAVYWTQGSPCQWEGEWDAYYFKRREAGD